MARTPFGKNKQKSLGNEDNVKRAKPVRKSKKAARESEERNEPYISSESSRREVSQPIAPIRMQAEHDVEDTVRNLRGSEGTLDEKKSNGREAHEPDQATYRQIAERAFMIFQESGGRHGHDWADWFEAERRIKET